MAPTTPFRVSNRWIEYAHEPGAEDGQPLASELLQMVEQAGGRDHILVPVDRPDLVREIVSQAELFTPERGQSREDRLWSMQASRTVQRGKAWLRTLGQPENLPEHGG